MLGSLAPGAPIALSLLAPHRATQLLAGARHWLVRENGTIIAVLCVVVAAELVGDAVVSLAG